MAVGIELAGRAHLRPERRSRIDSRLVRAALEGTGEAQREAALKLGDTKFGLADAVKPLSVPPVSVKPRRSALCARVLTGARSVWRSTIRGRKPAARIPFPCGGMSPGRCVSRWQVDPVEGGRHTGCA